MSEPIPPVTQTPEAPLSFREAMDELEGILERIEGEEIDIDRLDEELRRAAQLLDLCRGKIRKAEVEVTPAGLHHFAQLFLVITAQFSKLTAATQPRQGCLEVVGQSVRCCAKRAHHMLDLIETRVHGLRETVILIASR